MTYALVTTIATPVPGESSVILHEEVQDLDASGGMIRLQPGGAGVYLTSVVLSNDAARIIRKAIVDHGNTGPELEEVIHKLLVSDAPPSTSPPGTAENPLPPESLPASPAEGGPANDTDTVPANMPAGLQNDAAKDDAATSYINGPGPA